MDNLGFLGFTVLSVAFISFIFWLVPAGLWISSIASGVSINLFSLISMRLRRIPPAKIINQLIKAHQAGFRLEQSLLETHFLAGGNVNTVIDALISAKKDRIALSFEQAAAINLRGENILNSIKLSASQKS